MTKKKILFLADSTNDLHDLYNNLINDYDVYWVVYYKDLVEDLKKKKISSEKINYINSFDFYNSKSFLIRLLKRFLKIFSIEIDKISLIKKIKKIDCLIKPDLWITDTGGILAKIKTKAPKCQFKHSTTYKKYFLNKNIFDYDYIFLPGVYHFNRILEFYGNKIDKKKLVVAGSYRLAPFVKKKALNNLEKKELLKKFNLLENKINVLFAPTHDAFGKLRFFHKNFGNQFDALQKISDYIVNKLNGNFILKLHHYQNSLLENDKIKHIFNNKNNYVFNSKYEHQVEENGDIYRLSDIIITDTSGVSTTGIFLGKKIIFLEPDTKYHNWNEADIKSEFRPGFVCNNIDEIFISLKKYLNQKNLFLNEREKFLEEMFFEHEKDPTIKISNSIRKILN